MRMHEDDINRGLAQALEIAMRQAVCMADDPVAFLDGLDIEFARTLTGDLIAGQEKVGQMGFRAVLAAAFAEARDRVRRDFDRT